MNNVIAAACNTGSCTNSWQYATSSWSKGGVILGAVIVGLIILALIGATRKTA